MEIADAPEAFIDAALALKDRLATNAVLLLTDEKDVAELALKHLSDPVILVSSKQELYVELDPLVRSTLALGKPVAPGIDLMGHVKEVLISAFVNGSIGPDDRVLVLGYQGPMLQVFAVFDVSQDPELSRLRDELADRVDLTVVEAVLQLSMELAGEGREGTSVGTIFILGDTRKVLKRSRPVVINPFQGHEEETRNVLNEETWETIKEFSLVDGAFVIRGDGVIEAAGRYVDIDKSIELPSGLGGRHLAAASISRTTKAIAVVVSSSGTVRLFKNGEVLLTVGRV